jgi:ferrous iron transport protein B
VTLPLTALAENARKLPIVALVGNPNAGKTSVFNALTGLSQKVGNYAGVTVEKATGIAQISADQTVEVIDIPGLYSLKAVSVDEIVAVEALQSGPEQPELFVCVLDASNLERHLFFFSQLADLRHPTIVALTMTDHLRKEGITLDLLALEEALGVRVVPVVAHKGDGLDALRSAIAEALKNPTPPLPVGSAGATDTYLSTDERYEWAANVRRAVVQETVHGELSTSDKLDRLLTHRVFGLGVFVAVMYLVFQSIYTLAGPIMDGIEKTFGWLGSTVGKPLEGIPWLQSLVVDGLINGVGSVIIFLPQIIILFFFIAVLEGTGYLARAAFLMDRILGWCGLSGRAFIPLLSSFACAIPGIMAARVMPDQRSRLATILVAPLMSCSARLPVYVVLIGAFIQPRFGAGWAGFALFAMHFVGLLVAIPIVLVVNRKILRGKRLPFVLELPRYQWPKWRDVWLSMYLRAKAFVITAGTVIVVMSVIIWALLYFPRSPDSEATYKAAYAAKSADYRSLVTEDHFVLEQQTENSYLGRFGKSIEPVFRPAGFDWRVSTAILCAFPAREVVVSAMGILFNVGNEADEKDLDLAMRRATWPDGRPLFTPWTAVGLMVFFALCSQCLSTLATIRRETGGWRWPAFVFVYMTALAYIAAVGINALGRAFGG